MYSSRFSRQAIVALAAVCLSSMMFGLEISSVPAILPALEKALHADFRQLQWTMNAYTIAVATVLMAAGTLADRYGRRRVYLVSIAAFGLTSIVCGLAPDMELLIVARALQGAAGGVMLICQIAVLSQQFDDPATRARAFGWWGIVFGFGLGFGPLIGGAIAALAGWSWVFLVHGFVAVATMALTATGVRESRDPGAQRLDLGGIVTLSVAVFCLVFFITQGAALGFGSATALAILGVAVLAFVAFLFVEATSAHPMFDFAVLRVRRFSGALIGSTGMNFSFWPFMIYLPIWIEAGLGFRGLDASLALLAYTLPTLVVPHWAERLALRYDAGIVIPAGLFTIGLGFLLMKFATDLGVGAWPLTLLGAVFAGAGLGATNTPVTNTTTSSVTSDRAGMASGIDMSARMISLALNIAMMGFVLVRGIGGEAAERIAAGGCSVTDAAGCNTAFAHGFGQVMLYGAVAVWIAAAASRALFRGTKKRAAVMVAD